MSYVKLFKLQCVLVVNYKWRHTHKLTKRVDEAQWYVSCSLLFTFTLNGTHLQITNRKMSYIMRNVKILDLLSDFFLVGSLKRWRYYGIRLDIEKLITCWPVWLWICLIPLSCVLKTWAWHVRSLASKHLTTTSFIYLQRLLRQNFTLCQLIGKIYRV